MKPLRISGERQLNIEKLKTGKRTVVRLNAGELYDNSDVYIPVRVMRGVKPGPTLFITGGVHGDELNGIAIIRSLFSKAVLRELRGVLIAVPTVNVFAFHLRSRYLPDRRDLNRFFPGNAHGSLASRLAHLVMQEIVEQSDYGIDLHTAAVHRANYPHIRANMGDPQLKKMALKFAAPVVLNSAGRKGSLRHAACLNGVPTIVYEAGEALRFDPNSIRVGVRGVLNILRQLGMLKNVPREKSVLKNERVFSARSSFWIRAPRAGVLLILCSLGSNVRRGQIIAQIADPLGKDRIDVKSAFDGVIVGQIQMPLVNHGDAILHVATAKDARTLKQELGAAAEMYDEELYG